MRLPRSRFSAATGTGPPDGPSADSPRSPGTGPPDGPGHGTGSAAAEPGTEPASPPPPPAEAGWLSRLIWQWAPLEWRGWLGLAAAILTIAALGAAVAIAIGALVGGDETLAPAPRVVITPGAEPEEPEEIGFPAFATQSTTRIGGRDPIADAAGAALATYPSTGGVDGPAAVTMVDSSDWRGGLAAASLVATPIGAPILLGDPEGVPKLTLAALQGLAPRGLPATDSTQLFRVGEVGVPEGLATTEVGGATAAATAAAIDRLRTRLTGRRPTSLVLVSAEEPEFAMPAAAWAARSGDPILFVESDSVPAATLRALRRHPEARAYVLGPPSVVTDRVLRTIRKTVASVTRISAQDPVTNAIEFARFADGEFGWNINDPGHGLVIANTARPLDAAAAAPLSGSGKPGPLLLTDEADSVPGPLREFLLDTKPGYREDPTRAVYNHVWLIGDVSAISVAFQAQVDELTELERIRDGAGEPALGPDPAAPEVETGV
jgi:hypothetical protein